MKNEKFASGGRNVTIWWTVIAAIWIVLMFTSTERWREPDYQFILAVITAGLSIITCVLNWIKYLRNRKNEENDITGGSNHD